ncbi:4558_t:CDS:2 [Racocetra fulgida]|uniref:4558_t:CDS:1 n=1 Tax=Racocetra fulgida TaxID=60492 RepID=A0A9N9BXH1_9GLOM|nr:4558_t:CDS:2 [Racocetra fulgida]
MPTAAFLVFGFVVLPSLDKAIVVLKLIKSAYNGMDEVSSNYNKGYQKPGKTNCETRQSKVLTIDPDFLDDLEIFFLADVARDSNLNPYKLFKSVIVKKLENNVLATIHDEKSVVYRIINPDEIQHEKTLGGGMEKFAYHVEVVGDQERNILQNDIATLQNSADVAVVEGLNKKISNLRTQNEELIKKNRKLEQKSKTKNNQGNDNLPQLKAELFNQVQNIYQELKDQISQATIAWGRQEIEKKLGEDENQKSPSPENKKEIVVDLIKYEENDLGEYENIEIQFKSGKILRTRPKDYVESVKPEKKEIFLKDEEITLFFNNSTKTPNLLDAETIYLEDL